MIVLLMITVGSLAIAYIVREQLLSRKYDNVRDNIYIHSNEIVINQRYNL